MRLPKSSPFRAILVIIISFSLILSVSVSLRLTGVSAQPVKSHPAPPQVLSHSLATVKMLYLKFLALSQSGVNLSTIRSNAPAQPSYSQTGSLPPHVDDYDDPKPSNTTNYDSYLTQLAARNNVTLRVTTKKQNNVDCVKLSSASQVFSSIGGIGSVAVAVTSASCFWEIQNKTSWITITSATSGNNDAVITFNVSPTTAARTGTLTIGNNLFTVIQEVNPCSGIKLSSPKQQSIPGFDSLRNVVADFNGDGVIDIAGPYGSNRSRIGIIFGDGTGGFRDLQTFQSSYSSSLTAADFNNDGKMDLAFYEPYFSRITVMLNDGKGSFSRSQQIDPVNYVYYTDGIERVFQAADFNHDNKLDLLVNVGSNEGVFGPPRFVVLAGNGDGTFTNTITTLPIELTDQIIDVGDFNGDGNLDLASWRSLSGRIDIWFGDGRGGFTWSKKLEVEGGIWNLAAGDLNADGLTDLSAISSESSVIVFLAEPNNEFATPVNYRPEVSIGNGIFQSDITSDGRPELFTNYTIGIFQNNGDGSFFQIPEFREYGVAVLGDTNGDGRNDLLILEGYISSFEVEVLTNLNLCLSPDQTMTTSAASYSSVMPASESVAALFGEKLSHDTVVATTQPLPTSLANTSVIVKDSRGKEFSAPLFFISPNQINFQVPAGAAMGTAIVSVKKSDGSTAAGVVEVTMANPGLFSANASGAGLAAAVVLRVKANGERVYEPIGQFDPGTGRFAALPVDVSNPAEQVFLLLYGTGFRHHSGLNNVRVAINGAESEVLFAGAQGEFVGLDQCNVRLPNSLAGRGEISIALTVDGRTSNTVTARIK